MYRISGSAHFRSKGPFQIITRPRQPTVARLKHLLDAGSGDGRWAILVLDSTTARSARFDGSDDLVGLDIAFGDTAKHDVLAVEP
jgi:hypothetical protein